MSGVTPLSWVEPPLMRKNSWMVIFSSPSFGFSLSLGANLSRSTRVCTVPLPKVGSRYDRTVRYVRIDSSQYFFIDPVALVGCPSNHGKHIPHRHVVLQDPGQFDLTNSAPDSITTHSIDEHKGERGSQRASLKTFAYAHQGDTGRCWTPDFEPPQELEPAKW